MVNFYFETRKNGPNKIIHIVTYMRFPWFNNVSSATTMEQYNTCVSLVTQTILGD
jgi:hypothetical protein